MLTARLSPAARRRVRISLFSGTLGWRFLPAQPPGRFDRYRRGSIACRLPRSLPASCGVTAWRA